MFLLQGETTNIDTDFLVLVPNHYLRLSPSGAAMTRQDSHIILNNSNFGSLFFMEHVIVKWKEIQVKLLLIIVEIDF